MHLCVCLKRGSRTGHSSCRKGCHCVGTAMLQWCHRSLLTLALLAAFGAASAALPCPQGEQGWCRAGLSRGPARQARDGPAQLLGFALLAPGRLGSRPLASSTCRRGPVLAPAVGATTIARARRGSACHLSSPDGGDSGSGDDDWDAYAMQHEADGDSEEDAERHQVPPTVILTNKEGDAWPHRAAVNRPGTLVLASASCPFALALCEETGERVGWIHAGLESLAPTSFSSSFEGKLAGRSCPATPRSACAECDGPSGEQAGPSTLEDDPRAVHVPADAPADGDAAILLSSAFGQVLQERRREREADIQTDGQSDSQSISHRASQTDRQMDR